MKIADLRSNELSYIERDRLLAHIDPLLAYLGAPGDWGYGTVLGQFAIELREIQHAVRTAAIKT